jgi:hypothetical protein
MTTPDKLKQQEPDIEQVNSSNTDKEVVAETEVTAEVATGDDVKIETETAQPETSNPIEAINFPELSITVEQIRSSHTEPKEDPRLITMKVNYPKNFKGKRYHKDGSIIKVSKELADKFESLGIAKRSKQH